MLHLIQAVWHLLLGQRGAKKVEMGDIFLHLGEQIYNVNLNGI